MTSDLGHCCHWRPIVGHENPPSATLLATRSRLFRQAIRQLFQPPTARGSMLRLCWVPDRPEKAAALPHPSSQSVDRGEASPPARRKLPPGPERASRPQFRETVSVSSQGSPESKPVSQIPSLATETISGLPHEVPTRLRGANRAKGGAIFGARVPCIAQLSANFTHATVVSFYGLGRWLGPPGTGVVMGRGWGPFRSSARKLSTKIGHGSAH